jgi:hypothetical protein
MSLTRILYLDSRHMVHPPADFHGPRAQNSITVFTRRQLTESNSGYKCFKYLYCIQMDHTIMGLI